MVIASERFKVPAGLPTAIHHLLFSRKLIAGVESRHVVQISDSPANCQGYFGLLDHAAKIP
jgi:hypothetical protein